MKKKLLTFVKTYEEPAFDEEGKLIGKATSGNIDGDAQEKGEDEEDDIADLKAELPLGEGVLTINLGIPIIVVLSKIDLMMRGEKQQYLESNIDFI